MKNIKLLTLNKEEFLHLWQNGVQKIILCYTGPAKKKAISITCAALLLAGSASAFAIHHAMSGNNLSPVHAKILEQTSTDATPTDATTAQTTTAAPETTTEPATAIETTTAESVSQTQENHLSVIPVSELDISDEDLSTDAETINRNQANYTPALPSGSLSDISKATGYYQGMPGFLCGIDVSKHQGKINWTSVKNDGIQFAFIKVAGRGYETGKLYYDTRYKENLSGAAAAGIETGAYFFSQATSVQEAREEASMIIDALKGYKITYPVVFDWETANGYRTYSGLSKSTMTAMAETFCDMLEAAGYQAMVYANTFDFERFRADEITSRYGAWLARYPANYDGNGLRYSLGDGLPSLAYPYQIWQYSSTGRVNGISENVDMNVAFIDLKNENIKIPMIFETSESLSTTRYIAINPMNQVKAYNTACADSTTSVQVSIQNLQGKTISMEEAVSVPGTYQITYSLKDFTGYTGRKMISFSVYDQPVITLYQDSLTVSASMTLEELQDMVIQNIQAATDALGNSAVSSVVISYPASYYEEVLMDVTEPETKAEPEALLLSETETTEIETEPESTSQAEETTSEETTEETTTETEKIPVFRLIPGEYTILYSLTDFNGIATKELHLTIQEDVVNP